MPKQYTLEVKRNEDLEWIVWAFSNALDTILSEFFYLREKTDYPEIRLTWQRIED